MRFHETLIATLLLSSKFLVAQAVVGGSGAPPPCVPVPGHELLPIAGVGLGGGRIEGQNNLTILIWAPACPTEPHPAALLIHGGGFTSGSARDLNQLSLANSLVSAGIAVFSLSYRLAPAATLNDMITDVQRSVRYVRHEAPRFNVDPHKIMLIGDEAGGYLATIAGLMPPQTGKLTPYDWDRESDEIQAVVVLAGAGDFGKGVLPPTKGVVTPRGWTLVPNSELDHVNASTHAASNMPVATIDPLSLVHSAAPPFLSIQGHETKPDSGDVPTKLLHKLQAVGDRTNLISIPHNRQESEGSQIAGKHPEWQLSMIGWIQYTLDTERPLDDETARVLHIVQ
jgi:acetyl esterase/lipase